MSAHTREGGPQARRFAALFAALTITIFLGSASRASAQAGQENGCPKAPSSSGQGSTGQVRAEQLTSLEIDESPVQTFEFGGERGWRDRTLNLDADPDLEPGSRVIAEIEGDLAGEDGGDAFPIEGITVSPSVTNFGNVRLYVCMDPDEPEEVATGRYIGVIQVGGPGLETTTVGLTATLRDRWYWAVIAGLVGLLIGVLLKATADLSKDPKSKVTRRELTAYVKRPAFYGALFLGFVGVALSYWQLYTTNDVWGSGEDWFKMFAAGVALQVTGVTAIDLIRPFKSGGT